MSVFGANNLTGALAAVSGSPVSAGTGPDAVAFSSGGQLLAVTNLVDDTVDVFSVAGSGGALSAVAGSPFSTGDEPRAVAFSPGGALLAVANAADDTVSVFSVDPSAGALTPVSGSPFPAGADPVGVAFSPNGQLLAVTDEGDDTVSIYDVGAGGPLTPVAGSPFPTGGSPTDAAFSPSGALLAVTNGADDTVSVFAIAPGGSPTAVPGSPFPTGSDPSSVAFNAGGSLLATADWLSGDVALFTVGAGGSLSALPGSPFAAGLGPHSVAFTPGGNVLAVADAVGDSVSVLAPTPPTATISLPAPGGFYTLGQQIPSSFSCADSAYGPGVATCVDNNHGSAPAGALDTTTAGTHTYTVTATSIDGQSSTTSISYSVTYSPPIQTAAPQISGARQVGDWLYCDEGSWTGLPSTFTYEWFRNGVPIAGVDTPGYVVRRLDAGSTLSCAVTATGAGGTVEGNLLGRAVITAPRVRGCPALSGRIGHGRVGPVRLGQTEAQAEAGFPQALFHLHDNIASFCLTPRPLVAAFPTAALLRALPAAVAPSLSGRAIIVMTTNPRYALAGITDGSVLADAEPALRHRRMYTFGRQSILLARTATDTSIVIAKNGIVTAIGIAAKQLSGAVSAELALIRKLTST